MYTFIKDHEDTKLHWFFKILCWGILIHKLQKETKTPAIVLPSLSLGEEENFGRETPGVTGDLLYGPQLQHHQDVFLHPGAYRPLAVCILGYRAATGSPTSLAAPFLILQHFQKCLMGNVYKF